MRRIGVHERAARPQPSVPPVAEPHRRIPHRARAPGPGHARQEYIHPPPGGARAVPMGGAYNKVFLIGKNVPADTYLFFVEKLMETIRDEIADCCEKAYGSLPVKDAARILFLE